MNVNGAPGGPARTEPAESGSAVPSTPEDGSDPQNGAESPLMTVARRVAEIPLDDLRAYVAQQPQKRSRCATCGEPIRSTPSVHADGSVHMASGGWEHIGTESAGCDWASHPYGFAAPFDPDAVHDHCYGGDEYGES